MADTSPLVNLDLINKIYKTINAQINERVYDPRWNSEATLGSSTDKYKSAYVSGNISTGTLNNLTLTASEIGFAISGGTTTSKTLTVADTVTINKSLTVGADSTGAVTIQSSGAKDTTIQGPSNSSAKFLVTTTVGDSTNNGGVTVRSAGKNATTFVGPDGGTVTFTPPTSTTTATITVAGASGTDPTYFATVKYVDDYLGDVEALLKAI